MRICALMVVLALCVIAYLKQTKEPEWVVWSKCSLYYLTAELSKNIGHYKGLDNERSS